jgi:hypothetical protein
LGKLTFGDKARRGARPETDRLTLISSSPKPFNGFRSGETPPFPSHPSPRKVEQVITDELLVGNQKEENEMDPTMLFDSEDPDMYGFPGKDFGDGGLNLNRIGIAMMEDNGRSAAYVEEEVDA